MNGQRTPAIASHTRRHSTPRTARYSSPPATIAEKIHDHAERRGLSSLWGCGAMSLEEPAIAFLLGNQIGGAFAMPAPMSHRRRGAIEPQSLRGWARQTAAVQHRDHVPALAPHWVNVLLDVDRLCLPFDIGFELGTRGQVEASFGGFLVAYDAAGHVPAGAVVFVIAPCEKCAERRIGN